MIEPRIDDLLEHVDSRYALVIVAAKRARQINSYHHQLGEGIGFDVAPPPLIESRSKNYLTMAMEEVAQAKIAYAYPKPNRGASSAHPSPFLVASNGHTMPMARIVLGITGGIAAYKACEIIRLLVRAGHDVLPLPTRGAERFVAAETFYALARTTAPADPYPHLQRADLFVVAPLTAHTMARLAHGLADDTLTEAVLAHDGPDPRRTRHEHPHVAAPGDAGEPTSCCSRAASRSSGRRAASSPRARSASAAWPSRRTSSRGRRRCSGSRARSGTSTCSSPPVGPGSRSTPCGSSATARRGAWASRSPARRAGAGARVTLLAANVTVQRAARRRGRLDPDGRRSRARGAGAQRRGRDPDGLLRSPTTAPPSRSTASGRRTAATWKVELTPTTDIAQGARCEQAPGSGARRVRRRARCGRARAQAGDARTTRTSISSSTTMWDAPTSASTAPTTRSRSITADGDRLVPRAPKPAIAVAVLDEVERLLEGR